MHTSAAQWATDRIVRDDGAVVARGTGERATVTSLALDVADDGTFGHGPDWKHVANGELRLLSAVHELAGVQAFHCDKRHLLQLVPVSAKQRVRRPDSRNLNSAAATYGSWNMTFASGAPRPASWTISRTIPLMYPAHKSHV